MTSVSDYFNASTSQDLADKYRYILHKDEESSLSIFKVTEESECFRLEHPIKGLIVDQYDHIVAPGIPIPIDSSDLSEQQIRELVADDNTSIYNALDGVNFRHYFHNGQWRVSTSGMIYPNGSWGPLGCSTFIDMYADVADQVDYDKLNPNYCYHTVMLHKSYQSFTEQTVNKLVLSEIVGKDMKSIPLEGNSEAFNHVLHKVDPEALEARVDALFIDSDPQPVHPENFGLLLRFEGGVTRLMDKNSKHAMDCLPNLPDPALHWVCLLDQSELDILPESLEEFMKFLTRDKVRTYLQYFPWRQKYFQYLEQCFIQAVKSVYNEYREYTSTEGYFITARYCRYVQDLVDDYPDGNATEIEIAYHLVGEDRRRIIHLMNPHNQHQRPKLPKIRTVISKSTDSAEDEVKSIKTSTVEAAGVVKSGHLFL